MWLEVPRVQGSINICAVFNRTAFRRDDHDNYEDSVQAHPTCREQRHDGADEPKEAQGERGCAREVQELNINCAS